MKKKIVSKHIHHTKLGKPLNLRESVVWAIFKQYIAFPFLNITKKNFYVFFLSCSLFFLSMIGLNLIIEKANTLELGIGKIFLLLFLLILAILFLFSGYVYVVSLLIGMKKSFFRIVWYYFSFFVIILAIYGVLLSLWYMFIQALINLTYLKSFQAGGIAFFIVIVYFMTIQLYRIDHTPIFSSLWTSFKNVFSLQSFTLLIHGMVLFFSWMIIANLIKLLQLFYPEYWFMHASFMTFVFQVFTFIYLMYVHASHLTYISESNDAISK